MRSIIETASMAKRRTRNDHGKAFGIYGDQLTANQFDKLNWNTLRKAITTPGGKRLYVFLRSREGFRLWTASGCTRTSSTAN